MACLELSGDRAGGRAEALDFVFWELKDQVVVGEGFTFYPRAVVEEMELGYGVYVSSPALWTRAKPLRAAAWVGAEGAAFPR